MCPPQQNELEALAEVPAGAEHPARAKEPGAANPLTPETRQTYHVFLASPSDVRAQRDAARGFFKSYNETDAGRRGLHFEVVDWENYATTGVGRPQELITEQTLERFRGSLALVIGIMGVRFGSPSGAHDSGTEEELEWALKASTDSGFPEIKWFFRDVERLQFPVNPEQLADALAQWHKVCAFRKRVDAEKLAFYRTFDSIESFKTTFDRDLRNWLNAAERPWNAAKAPVAPEYAVPRDDHSPRKTAPTGIALTLAAGAALLLGVGALVAAWPRDEVVLQGVVRSATLEPVASHRVSLDDCVRQSTMTDEHGAYAMPQRLPSRCRGQELKLVIEGYCGANRQVVVTTERGSVGLPLCEQKQEPITKVLPDEPPEVRPGTRSLNPERVVEGALRPSANSGLDERTRPGLARASRAVGRIRFGGNALSGGTTFLVSEGLVVTASYSRAGEEWNTGCVAFAEAATDRCIPVTGARTVSEHWGLAFLTLAGTPPGVESLPLAASFETSAPVGSVIAVIGFPEQDGRKPKELQDSLFDQLGVKWVQPGISFGVSPLRFLQRERDTLTHNAFTLGGNGGSPVVAAESAVVVAVHHSAQWESKTNQNLGFAIPTNKLYGDPAIRKLPLLWKTDPDKPAHLDVITKVP